MIMLDLMVQNKNCKSKFKICNNQTKNLLLFALNGNLKKIIYKKIFIWQLKLVEKNN